MACIFNTVSLDHTAGITDSFEGRGAYSSWGAHWRGGAYSRRGLIRGNTVIVVFQQSGRHHAGLGVDDDVQYDTASVA